MTRTIELYTTGPARILRLNRGRLEAGGIADVTIFSTRHKWTYDVNKSASKSRNSPFHGRKFIGGQLATIVNGNVLWRAIP